jgi:tRNA G10  N-methylase Trm11
MADKVRSERPRIVWNLSNLDIMESDLPFGRVDAVYSDPPWGGPNLKYWRTHNGQVGHPVDWGGFLGRFFYHCKKHCPNGPWYVETGVRFIEDLVKASPLCLSGFRECRYKAGSKWLPNVLLAFGHQFPAQPLPGEDRYGVKLVRWCLSEIEAGSSVLDPCCGLGLTAKACVTHGLNFYGNELNPKRLERTRKVLEAS